MGVFSTNKRIALGWSRVGGVAVACSPDSVTTPKHEEGACRETGLGLDLPPPGQKNPITPRASSAACSVGAAGAQQLVRPEGYIYSVVGSEGPGFRNNADMNTLSEGGQNKRRFLYRTHEVNPNASVSVTDLVTGASRI